MMHTPTPPNISNFQPKKKVKDKYNSYIKELYVLFVKRLFQKTKDTFYFRPSVALFISSSIRTTHTFGFVRIIAEPRREKYTFIVETFRSLYLATFSPLGSRLFELKNRKLVYIVLSKMIRPHPKLHLKFSNP